MTALHSSAIPNIDPSLHTYLDLLHSCTSPSLESLDVSLTPKVPFRGSYPADLTIIGEAPGKNEVKALKPFIGRAGIFLEDALARSNFDLSSIFYTNACCFLPPRFPPTPSPEEISICSSHLHASLHLADSPYLLILGATATHAIFGPHPSFSHRRGRFTSYNVPNPDGSHSDYTAIAFVTYHPGAALRNGQLAEIFRQDIATLRAQMDQDPIFRE